MRDLVARYKAIQLEKEVSPELYLRDGALYLDEMAPLIELAVSTVEENQRAALQAERLKIKAVDKVIIDETPVKKMVKKVAKKKKRKWG